METGIHIAEVDSRVSNLPRHLLGVTNTVQINLDELIRHETGGVTVLSSRRIRLRPRGRGFTPRQLSGLLQHVPETRYLGRKIALDINQKFAIDSSLQEPVFVSVNVELIRERTFMLPLLPPDFLHIPPSSSSRGASSEVFQRLSEEQRVESKDLVVKNEAQCSICIDDLSKTRENVIELPQCLHIFHQDCLFEWLRRQNSCPLCRRAPYEL
ncbi:hypothetical protein HA466_0109410 [Hirschfeldia incana]|nr:hypothetical protein HA466_0109410 [Hirschfeldia incana]